MSTFTVIHLLISFAALGAGFVVLAGLLGGKRPDGVWTPIFLATTLATSATGFGFPADRVLPSHVVGALSLVVLAVAAYALYGRRLAGPWRGIYVVTAITALYLNVFVLIVQSFLRIPALRAIAPTQTEQPFTLTQALVLATFAIMMKTAVRASRAAAAPSVRT
jgi:hypothetical protein